MPEFMREEKLVFLLPELSTNASETGWGRGIR